MKTNENTITSTDLEWSALGKFSIAAQPILIALFFYFFGHYLVSTAAADIELALGNLSKFSAIITLFTITQFWEIAFFRKPTKEFKFAPWATKRKT